MDEKSKGRHDGGGVAGAGILVVSSLIAGVIPPWAQQAGVAFGVFLIGWGFYPRLAAFSRRIGKSIMGSFLLLAVGLLLMLGGGYMAIHGGRAIYQGIQKPRVPAPATAGDHTGARSQPPDKAPQAGPSPPQTPTPQQPNAAPAEPNDSRHAEAKGQTRLVINCRNGVMPTVQMKASERLYVLSLPQVARQGLGFMEYFTMKDGSEMKFSAEGKPPPSAYTCVVDNFGNQAFAKVKVGVHIWSWNVITDGNSSKIGDFSFETSGNVEIPVLPPGQGAFVFYILNTGTLYHEIRIDERAQADGVNSGVEEKLGVIATPSALFSWPQQF